METTTKGLAYKCDSCKGLGVVTPIIRMGDIIEVSNFSGVPEAICKEIPGCRGSIIITDPPLKFKFLGAEGDMFLLGVGKRNSSPHANEVFYTWHPESQTNMLSSNRDLFFYHHKKYCKGV